MTTFDSTENWGMTTSSSPCYGNTLYTFLCGKNDAYTFEVSRYVHASAEDIVLFSVNRVQQEEVREREAFAKILTDAIGEHGSPL